MSGGIVGGRKPCTACPPVEGYARCNKEMGHGGGCYMPRLYDDNGDPVSDPINSPAHYTHGKYEVTAVIEDWRLDWHLGNVVKYIARHAHKGTPVEDLMKAQWYLSRGIWYRANASGGDQ